MKPLTKEQIVRWHAESIRVHGGADGIRDEGVLDSALASPWATFGGELLHSTVPEIAAAYLYYICNGHPFIDGNKRTSAITALAFAEINGWRSGFAKGKVAHFTLQVAKSELSKAALTVVFENKLIAPTQ